MSIYLALILFVFAVSALGWGLLEVACGNG